MIKYLGKAEESRRFLWRAQLIGHKLRNEGLLKQLIEGKFERINIKGSPCLE